jgi:hypothetical protein
MTNILNQILLPYRLFFLNLRAAFKNILFFSVEGKKVYSNTDEFKQHEFAKKGEQIKESYKKILKKLRIRNDLYLIEYPHPMCFSIGYNFSLSKSSHAAIFMSEGLFELDKDAFSFIFKHEISHIKFNDVFIRSIVSFLFLLISASIASCFISTWRAIFIAFFLLPTAYHFLGGLWMHYREYRADVFAMNYGDIDEIKGGIRYFSAIKKYNASLSHIYPQYTMEGELAHGFHYPKTANRIKVFVNELKKRTGTIYEPENEFIDKHVDLLKINDAKLKDILTSQV